MRKKTLANLRKESFLSIQLQRVSEEVFKDLKLIKDKTIDKDAFAKHMDDKVKDASWKPVMKAAADQCVKEVTEKKVEILNELAKEPFNIKPDQCNGIYMSLVTCIHLVGFGVWETALLFTGN